MSSTTSIDAAHDEALRIRVALEAINMLDTVEAVEDERLTREWQQRARDFKRRRFADWLQSLEPQKVRRMAASGKLSAAEVTQWNELYERRLSRARWS